MTGESVGRWDASARAKSTLITVNNVKVSVYGGRSDRERTFTDFIPLSHDGWGAVALIRKTSQHTGLRKKVAAKLPP
jgi:hypothetical protein